MDEVVHLRRISLWQRRCLHVERLLRDALRENLHVRIVVFDIDEIERFERGRELLREKLGVFFASAKDHHAAHVAEDRIARLLFDLIEELVRHRERELVFSSFGKDAGNRIGRDVLELVDI